VAAAGSEILTPAGRRWAERAQRPLDVLAVVFLIDMILIWSFPDGPPAFLRALDVISWIVWASFAVDYIARLLLSGNKGGFARTRKLDLLMVLLPMLRLLRVFLLLRRSLASVSTEKIAGSIVSIVIAVVVVSAFFMWRWSTTLRRMPPRAPGGWPPVWRAAPLRRVPAASRSPR